MASYQRLPTSPVEQHELQQQQQEQEQDEPELSTSNAYSRATLDEFNRPEPAWWKRALVIVAIIFSGWLAFRIGHSGNSKAKVIYATRYSEEFKYRPAESPVITEYLKDGRMRLRGASPGGVGIRPGDIPLTPRQQQAVDRVKREEAEKKAKEQLKDRKRKRKEERLERKRRTAQAAHARGETREL